MATLTTLAPETVTKLQNLIQIAVESMQGFEQVAAADTGYKAINKAFNGLAKQREQFAENLKQWVEWSADQGIGVNAIDQWWIDAPDQAANDLNELLAQIVSAEQALAQYYGDLLEETIGTPAYDELATQRQAIDAAVQQITSLQAKVGK